MATPHNCAQMGEIARTVLLPGDPLRAKFIAENFLSDVRQFNSVRNMFGYTGKYDGKDISVMGTGMGCASIGIYTYELIHMYGVQNLIRIGSCGAIQEDIDLGDIIMAAGSSTDSNYAHQYKLPGSFSAIASYRLLSLAQQASARHGFPYRVGNVLSSDIFYNETEEWRIWAKMGVMAVEMESYALYCNAARAGVDALGIFTVSDSLVTGREMSAKEREIGFTNMMTVALETAVALQPEKSFLRDGDNAVPVQHMEKDTDPTKQEEGGIHPLLMKFLDASSCEERLEIFNDMEEIADLHMLEAVAASMDLSLGGDVSAEEAFSLIRDNLETQKKYECSRWR